jgi:hypothetical protein
VKGDERGEVVEKGEEGERNRGEMIYFEEYEYIYKAKNTKNTKKQEEEKRVFKKKGDGKCNDMED